MLLKFQKKLRRLNSKQFLVLGSAVLFFTMLMVFFITDCNLDYNNQNGNLRSEYCRRFYYHEFKLLASGRKNCSRIINGDLDEVRNALIDNLIVANRRVLATERDYMEVTKDCTHFKKMRKYVLFSFSDEETNYPIAYSMVIHSDIEMFERLLRSIYMPQNVYCIHVDMKSSETFFEAVKAIASCFPNVFVSSKRESVIYASWSRVQADLYCMEDLLNSNVDWKYLINTCGTDFPLKTNAEMVKALKLLNGKNSMESEIPPSYKKIRWEYHYEIKNYPVRTSIQKNPPPLNTPIFSGNAYVVLTRDFVKSLFENSLAKELIEWAKDTYSPDEYIWATLQRIPGMPGSVPNHIKYDMSDLNALARLVKWESLEGDMERGAPYSVCTGKHRREICVYGTGDLHWLVQQHHFFANKFDPRVDDHAIQCLEEYLRYKLFYGKNV
ncbi:beta-1,3-galactosyl-O-glycosyl-glycoprotein beta-1,6-N-acetylglucosaminyltransferase 3 [Hyla sarda]|uniref:beta-1,3-galactosyl-O-glycosyl-glycoprotein beta-1,6-N-acetylglucosaminyltransferase 3 n=1 Tax=Hyla sarda TaxID=327740 RepID=UPI0024C24027|nr:beta-1,3-galactosyl-O-glycosyl-glycoprotein beta-1,6-N-acetylglucosaminyltransferase 3 [Hyla sarda]